VEVVSLPACAILGLPHAYRQTTTRRAQIKRREKGKAWLRVPTLMQQDLLTLGWTNEGERYQPLTVHLSLQRAPLDSNPLMQLRVATTRIEALEPQTEGKVGCRPVLTL